MKYLTVLSLLALSACKGAEGDSAPSEPEGVAILGGGSHTMDSLTLSEIATASDGLDVPRDLEFHPLRPSELWVINREGPSVTIIDDPASAPVSETVVGPAGEHFMARPSALAFEPAGGALATAPEEDEKTQGANGSPADFMGPSMFATARDTFDAGYYSHLDMLHNSPNSAGIAWEVGSVFWIFDGAHQSLTRYDFNGDHGEGGADHSDATVHRYVEGEVGYEPDVPSHMVFDGGLLYVADTSNSRIAVLDPSTGAEGGSYGPNYDGGVQKDWDGASLWTLVDGNEHGMLKPSGMELHEGLLYVSDNQSGTIYAFDLDGELVDWLETGLPEGGLMGIAFDAEGALYMVDAVGDRVLRLSVDEG